MYSPKAQAIVLQKSLGKNVSKATTKHLSSNWTLPFENVFAKGSIDPRVVWALSYKITFRRGDGLGNRGTFGDTLGENFMIFMEILR